MEMKPLVPEFHRGEEVDESDTLVVNVSNVSRLQVMHLNLRNTIVCYDAGR